MTALLITVAFVYVACSVIIFGLFITTADVTNNHGEVVDGWKRTVVIIAASTLWPVLIFFANRKE